jgi:hypothetical protein
MLAAAEHRVPPTLSSAKVHFRPAATSEAGAVSSFLQQAFRPAPGSAFLDPRHLAWKYWADRADWPGPRSFTARHDEKIVAHVAAWPVTFRLPDRVVPAAHLIDWASDPKYPGAGIWLMRQMRAKTRLLIATGGTEITKRTLPALGFRPVGEVGCFARPLRPFGQTRTSAGKTWRLPARFVRNSMWRFSLAPFAPAGWTAAPIAPDGIDAAAWPQPSASTAVAVRDAAFYRYVLASPSTRHALFGLGKDGAPIGYFCLAYARHVARIADLWVTSSAPEDWANGFRCAAGVAAGASDIYEVTAWASTALGREALARAGFRLRDSSTLSVLGDATVLGGRGLHIQMLDCDASFLAADEISYLT